MFRFGSICDLWFTVAILQVDLFGQKLGDIFGEGHTPVKDKISALRDYRFHVVIENTRKECYFTEKLLDCFVSCFVVEMFRTRACHFVSCPIIHYCIIIRDHMFDKQVTGVVPIFWGCDRIGDIFDLGIPSHKS